MSEERVKSQLDKLKGLVIFSVTRINYLLQIIELSKNRNRIILRLQGFYAMAVRDLGTGAITAIRALHETRNGTHNINTLINSIRGSSISKPKMTKLEPVLKKLSQLVKEELPKDVTILASVSHVHKSIRLPKKEVVVKYEDMCHHLLKVGELFNKISSILWGASTLLYFPESEDDGFTQEMKHIELADDIGTWMMRLRGDDELVIRRKKFLKDREVSR